MERALACISEIDCRFVDDSKGQEVVQSCGCHQDCLRAKLAKIICKHSVVWFAANSWSRRGSSRSLKPPSLGESPLLVVACFEIPEC